MSKIDVRSRKPQRPGTSPSRRLVRWLRWSSLSEPMRVAYISAAAMVLAALLGGVFVLLAALITSS